MEKSNIELYKETGKDCYREAAIIEHAKLVKLIAAQMYIKCHSYMLEQSDYESFGIFGLIDAIDKYDPIMNVQFTTYASHRIRGAIIDELRKFDPLKRAVRDNQKLYRQYEEVAIQTFGPDFTREQLMNVNQISNKVLTQLERDAALDVAVSLDSLFHAYHNEDEAGFDVRDEKSINESERLILHENLTNIISEALNMLTEKERQVITMIYYEDMTQREIATVLNVVEARVSQLHRKALVKLGKNERIKQWQAV